MRRLFSLAVAAMASILVGSAAQAGPYDAWGYSMKISFPLALPGAVTNFPTLVTLSTNTPGFRYTDFNSPADGADLRFADSNQAVELNYEIERWDTNGSSFVWVQVPLIANAGDSIYAYWDRNVSAPPCTTNGAVWTNGYEGVWHLADTNALDSSTNRFASTNGGATNAPGRIGRSLGFNGTVAGRVNVGDVIKPASITLEAWANYDSALGTTHVCPVAKVNRYQLGIQKSNTNFWWAHIKDWAVNTTSFTVPVGTWAYLVMTYDAATGGTKAYANGQQVGTDTATAGALTYSTDHLAIGSRTTDFPYGGLVDEVRISNIPRGSNWVYACWLSQASNAQFSVCGQVTSHKPTVENAPPSAMTTGSANFSGTLVSTGSESAVVGVLWGPSDGGAGFGAWANTNWFPGTWAPTNFTTNVTLSGSGVFFYRYVGTNSYGAGFASPTTVVITGEVTVAATDASAGEKFNNTGTFTISRPASLTNGLLTVNYTVGGGASNGVDYAPLTGSASIPSGSATGFVTVPPYYDALLTPV
jgi:hypothetical protein